MVVSFTGTGKRREEKIRAGEEKSTLGYMLNLRHLADD